MSFDNEVNLVLESKGINESLARVIVVSFITPLNPTINIVNDIKTAVSEAVTNAIIHGYDGQAGKIYMNLRLKNDILQVEIKDNGIGIKDIDVVKEPLYTSKPEMERSGMGFTVMETFMDKLTVTSTYGLGTTIVMTKNLSREVIENDKNSPSL